VKRRDFVLAGGAAAFWPGIIRAQQKAMPVIGYLSASSPGDPLVAPYRQGLSDAGYVEGQNVTIEYRWAEGDYDLLAALAVDLVGRNVDVIAASPLPSALAAKRATSTIPIIFISGADPVEAGLVASLDRPGGNLTGVSFIMVELAVNRLDLILELVPRSSEIALLVNPTNANAEGIIKVAQGAAHAKGVELSVLKASNKGEIDAAFTSLVQLHSKALVVARDPFLFNRREQLVALASRHSIPAIYESREFVALGGLMSYGPSLTAVYRQFGSYTGKILKGARPGDLPVEQPTSLELAINLKTAKALGLAVPQSLLARADEVIE
jgi:putative ABC transport system substrate-binding protein